jgi:PAS domain S-box-containing protein
MDFPDRRMARPEFDDSPNLMALVRLDGVFNVVNVAWEKTLGYRADELVGRNLLRLVDDADRDTARRLLSPRPQAGKLDLSLKHKDGSSRGFEWERRHVPGEEANFIVGKDVTERRRLEVSVSLRMYELYAAARKKNAKKKP